jgi:hypothetical protein
VPRRKIKTAPNIALRERACLAATSIRVLRAEEWCNHKSMAKIPPSDQITDAGADKAVYD